MLTAEYMLPPPRQTFTSNLRNNLHPSLLEQRVECGLCDGFVDLRFGAAGGNAADGLAVHLDGQAALVREKVRKSEDIGVASFQGVGAVFRRTPLEGGVPGLFLRELDGVQRSAVGFLEKLQIAAF